MNTAEYLQQGGWKGKYQAVTMHKSIKVPLKRTEHRLMSEKLNELKYCWNEEGAKIPLQQCQSVIECTLFSASFILEK